jgi:hypothetical protein
VAEIRVLKYTVPVDGEWHEFDLNSSPMHVAIQEGPGLVQFWALDNGQPPKRRRFRVFATGEPLPEIVPGQRGFRYAGLR